VCGRQRRQSGSENSPIIVDVAATRLRVKLLAKEFGDDIHFGCCSEEDMCEFNGIYVKVRFAEFNVTRNQFKIMVECQEIVPVEFTRGCLNHS
jgi:hypothetical protein